MEKAHELAIQARQSLQTDAPKPLVTNEPRYNEKMIDRLFVRFNSIYGHLWASHFRSTQMLDAARAEWGLSLNGFSFDAIAHGISLTISYYKDYPPTLGQFLDLCDDYREIKTESHSTEPKPRKPVDKELVKQQIKKMREILRRGHK